MGGLGNQLFQIFSALSYAITNEMAIIFPYTDSAFGKLTERKVYWSSFLSSIEILTKKIIPKMEYLREKGFEYSPIPRIFGKNFILFGYYQSYKYFEKDKSLIFNMISLADKKNNVKNKYNYDFIDSVSMHFRIGDYINIQDKHPILEQTYYLNALQYLCKNNFSLKKVYYFTEKRDLVEVENIISFLKLSFPNLEFIYVCNVEEDWEEMLIMSLCENNIIANSTFSWWGAYFNNYPNKIVCYPSNWFGPALPNNTEDLFPPDWVKISS
jgi:hypothetical protein